MEERATVARDRQRLVARAVVDQPEERQQARPGAVAVAQAFAGMAAGLPVELLAQSFETVRLVVDGVVARQQIARFGKQQHYAAHHDPTTTRSWPDWATTWLPGTTAPI